MKKILYPAISFVAIIIVTVLILSGQSNKTEKFLDKYGFTETNIVDIVANLEERLDEPAFFQAGITGTHLMMSDDQSAVKIKLPSDQFYLSIAPYINQTHPCGIHNLVTCRGELQHQEFNVVVRDKKSNDIIFDQQVTTASNGFLGVWLPKNIEGLITISKGDQSATTDIATHQDDNTCLTTLKLT